MTIPSVRTTHLLVVDDDPSMLRLLKQIIEGHFENKIELASLTDPKQARSHIENQIVDILCLMLDFIAFFCRVAESLALSSK